MDLWTIAMLLVLVGFSLLAYSLGALDRRGAIASFALGLVIILAGGLGWLFLMAAFTGLGVVATRLGYSSKQARRVAEGRAGERGQSNVLANGLAAALAAATTWLDVVPIGASRLAFATAVAAVTADTLASEIGALQKTARRILPPFGPMRPGENGAVSQLGQTAAAVGAAVIAVLSVWLIDVPWSLAWIPALAGWLGCQLDSVLGATLEGDERREGPLSKQDVNFLASAVPAFLVLVLASLL